MAICRYCKKEIDKITAYKVGKASYYCNNECYELMQSKRNKTKAKYKPDENTSRRVLTDYMQEIYLSNGYDKSEINWILLMSQVSNMLKENDGWKYSGIKYTLWYMVEIKEMNLFDENFNGSILNLLPFMFDEAKKYWSETEDIKKAIEEFEFKDEIRVIKKIDNKDKIMYNIDTRF